MTEPVDNLVGLGPKSSAWLREAGINTREDLERVGVIDAYRKVRAAGHNVSLNLMWSMQGALMDLHWNHVPPSLRDKLKADLAAADAAEGLTR